MFDDHSTRWNFDDFWRGDIAADLEHETPEERRTRLLDAHIDRLWQLLPEQSKRRLGCIAASAGLPGVGVEEHADLVGAMGLIAEAEGTLDQEAEFADCYLHVPWVAEAVAEWERERAQPRAQSDERREQTKLAVRRYREKQRAKESAKERKNRERKEQRLSDMYARSAIAIDGEGITDRETGDHIYRYMAACTRDGTVLGELENPNGIPSKDVMEFIDGLPKRDEAGETYLGVFGYGLGYDQTKWLEGLKNRALYKLFHDVPELEDVKVQCGRYRLMLMGKCLQMTNKRGEAGSKRTLIWDILKGFQSTFVKALIAWEVGTKAEHERIEAMKKQRGNFDDEKWKEVQFYCKDECRLLAVLTETYIRAHVEAGIDLRGKYHGAGSTSDAFLSLMNALGKRCTREVEDEDLEAFQATRSAFLRSFFGGRAEISRFGIVRGKKWTADVASAYPHALFELPCVRHGKWRHVSARGVGRAIGTARLACVHFKVELQPEDLAPDRKRGRRFVAPLGQAPAELRDDATARRARRKKKELKELAEKDKLPSERAMLMGIQGDVAQLPWGPLPYRTDAGSIVFPAAHPGGWAWAPEYQVAKRHYPGVQATEAWVLRGECQCERPYQDIGHYYLRRLEWGGMKGKVLKLGMNGCYGKFAQVIGKNPKYSCRVIAGQITASTRGRLLEGIATMADPWDVIYAATDGLIATSAMSPPDPPENSTTKGAKDKGKAWLGSWEVEEHDENLFVVQPGFYFSMKDKGKARTRGTPLEVIDAYRNQIIDQWKAEPTKKPTGLPQQSVFHGVKSCIQPPSKKNDRYTRKKSYGTWSLEDRKINYVVNPKRSDLLDLEDGSFRLLTWWLFPDEPESCEYKKDPSFVNVEAVKDDQPDFVEPLVRGVGEDD
ncbi:MAG TPA: hypothetical protein VGK73_03910 [Polyangiaceae bacterium]